MSDSPARAMLAEAGDVVALFLSATSMPDEEATADLALSNLCERRGADNAAASLAAFCTLTLRVAAQNEGALLAEVRRRIGGGDPPAALVRA